MRLMLLRSHLYATGDRDAQWLGKGAAFVLPALLALGVATGVFAITNYLAPEQRALLEAQRSSE